MKITFHFENGTSQIFLVPETPRDERYLELVQEGKEVKIIPSKDVKGLGLEFKVAKDKT